MFKFDLKAGFPCFGTKLCHIKATIKACKKEKKKKKEMGSGLPPVARFYIAG